MQLSKDELKQAYRRMREIRVFEDRLHVEFAKGDIPGFVHLYAGQEASAVGACIHLNDQDVISSTHRGHGHCIAKGCDITGMMLEIYGKRDGLCGGKGGSMHIADLSKGMLGANGIVGGGPPLICGAALAAKLQGTGGVAMCFTGDGGSNQGTTLESLNLASVWKLPAIFIFENNGYAESTGSSWSVSSKQIVKRADAFGMPGIRVNGLDFFAVWEAVREAVERARAGGGPTLIEMVLTRYYGHYEGDAQTYRPLGEIEDYRQNKDCIDHFRRRVTGAGLLSEQELNDVDDEVDTVIDRAVEVAMAGELPNAADLTSDVYIRY